MGGDFGPSVTVPAAVDVVGQFPEVELILVGLKEQLEPALRKVGYNGSRVRIHHASQVVEMDEPAAQALRGKKDSSLRVSINLVHSGEAQGCVSAGNTGALMATARFVLKTLHGIDRPAIVTTLPSRRGHVHMLDLGANVDSPPERLVQFGIMGSELVRALDDIAEPKVGLLNIGVEDIKGDQVIKKAAELMRLSKLNFQGFIEGDGI
jgi:glycerol-3-phosphate acyltransferase PlsX